MVFVRFVCVFCFFVGVGSLVLVSLFVRFSMVVVSVIFVVWFRVDVCMVRFFELVVVDGVMIWWVVCLVLVV